MCREKTLHPTDIVFGDILWPEVCLLLLSCGMDPHACADGGGHGNGLLLHHRPADPGSRRLLHQRLALAHSGRLSAFLCVVPLLMVRLLLTTVSTFKMCQVH